MAMGIRVAGDEEGERDESCDKESNGFGGKSDGNEGGRRLTATRAMATVTAMTWVMVTVTRLAGNKEGKGVSGKGDGDEEAMTTVARAVAKAAMVAGEQWRWQRRG